MYQLCVACPESLADKLYIETKVFLDKHVKQLLDQMLSSQHDKILVNYYENWKKYNEGLIYLHELYS